MTRQGEEEKGGEGEEKKEVRKEESEMGGEGEKEEGGCCGRSG